jgi:pimeloyl-ACP methyl ester carboxylesterase
VLALDLPGNGESDGRSSGVGWTAQPGIDAAVGFLAHRRDVDPQRIAGFGASLGGEVVLEATAREHRLSAVISDGAARSTIGSDVNAPEGLAGLRARPAEYERRDRRLPRSRVQRPRRAGDGMSCLGCARRVAGRWPAARMAQWGLICRGG